MANEVFAVPPFPPLTWDQFHWVGEIRLPSWAGFQSRRRPCYGPISDDPSDGAVRLTVVSQNDEARTPPTGGQAQALQNLLDNESAIAAEILNVLFKYYPDDKAVYEESLGENADHLLPDLDEPGGLRAVLGLSSVHVLDVYKDGIAYVGFEFGCAWEEEHGAGVMTHLGRIAAVGQADSSFMAWVAQRDAMRSERKP